MQLRKQVMRLALGWRRWIVSGLVAVAIAASAYVVVPAVIPDRLVQARINEQIGHWTGGAFKLHSGAETVVKPGFRVFVSNPTFVSPAEADAGPVVTAERIVAQLRILPLLLGRVEIAELILQRPDIASRPGMSQSLTNGPLQGRREASSPLGEVILVDGAVRFGSTMGVDDISGLNLRLTTDVSSNAVSIRGGLNVGAQHLRVDLQLDDLRALVSDAGTQGRLNIRVGPRQDDDKDHVAPADQGLPHLITDRLRHLADVIDVSMRGLGSMAATGTFSVTPHKVAVTDATFLLGGMELNGHLRAQATDGQALVQMLKLPDAVNAMVARAADLDAGRWADRPVTLTWFDDLDVDVAMSGDDLRFGNLTLDTAAVAFVAAESTAVFDVTGNTMGLGDVQAGFQIDYAANEQIRFATSGHVENVSVSKVTQLLTAMGPPPLIGTAQLPEGTMDGSFDLRAKGRTLGQMRDSLSGFATARLLDGSLAGTDLVATLETLVRGREFMTEEHGPLIPAAGRTQFDQLDARVDFVSGTANVAGVDIAAEQFEINMLGEIELAEGRMNLGGRASLLLLPGAKAPAGHALVDLPFGLGGTVFAPVAAAGVPTVQADASVGD